MTTPVESIWREQLMRLRDALRVQLAWCSNPSGSPFPGMEPQHDVLRAALWNADAVIAEGEAKVAQSQAADPQLAVEAAVKAGAAPVEDRVTFHCSDCSPQVAKMLEDLINRAVSKRVESEKAKHQPIHADQSVAPMRRDANGGLHFDTSNWKHTPPPAPQRFSLGEVFHAAIAAAKSSAPSEFRGSPVPALIEAVGALGAAVEAELSRRP